MANSKPYRNKHDLQADTKKNPHLYYEMHVDQDGEPLPSQTIKGQTMTIKELFKRHREGQLIKERKYQYLDVEDIQNLEEFEFRRPNLDFTDLQKLVQRNQERQKMLKEQLELSKKINDRLEQETGKDLDKDGKVADPGPKETDDGKID